MPRRGFTTLLALGAVALVLAYGVYSVLVMAYSDRLAKEFTLPASKRALKVAPGNARYWVVYADLLEQAGEASTNALRQAATLDPEDASIWLRLGLDAEGRNDFGRAEKFLLQAARVSRLYEPRWTLANFYFRRGNSIEFWKYAHSALELAPREPEALFDLCWRMSQDATEILAKAIPDVRQVRRHYAEFLLAQNRLVAVHPVLMSLGDPTAEDRAVLDDACERFLAGGLAKPALDVWDLMCSRGVLPFKVLQPQAGVSLTNPDFAVPGFGRGFNWHIGDSPGITAHIGAGTAAVYFSGLQNETCETIWQWLPVSSSRSYSLRFQYQTQDLPERSGLVWEVATDAGKELGGSQPLSSEAWKSGTFGFQVPSAKELVRLRLRYSREPGTVRIQGAAFFRSMRLEMK